MNYLSLLPQIGNENIISPRAPANINVMPIINIRTRLSPQFSKSKFLAYSNDSSDALFNAKNADKIPTIITSANTILIIVINSICISPVKLFYYIQNFIPTEVNYEIVGIGISTETNKSPQNIVNTDIETSGQSQYLGGNDKKTREWIFHSYPSFRCLHPLFSNNNLSNSQKIKRETALIDWSGIAPSFFSDFLLLISFILGKTNLNPILPPPPPLEVKSDYDGFNQLFIYDCLPLTHLLFIFLTKNCKINEKWKGAFLTKNYLYTNNNFFEASFLPFTPRESRRRNTSRNLTRISGENIYREKSINLDWENIYNLQDGKKGNKIEHVKRAIRTNFSSSNLLTISPDVSQNISPHTFPLDIPVFIQRRIFFTIPIKNLEVGMLIIKFGGFYF